MKSISWASVALTAIVLLHPKAAEAFWRLPCRARSGAERIDPLMSPGEVSDHVHVIHGSGNFGMNATQATLQEASCTSCQVTQDKSAYWTPPLYFQYTNGTTVMVEQVGGMLAYYLLYGDNITAFPNNFRMIAGNQYLRNFSWPVPDPPKSFWSGAQESQFALQQKALGFNCLNYNTAPEPSLYRHFLPDKAYLDANCPDGVRFELMFPSCWNGKDVDSADHQSHMAYPNLVMTGDCPAGFDTRLVSLFYETIWNTYAFKDEEGQFIISDGDPTGFGYHGDFMQGWDPEFLQQAIETCTDASGEVQDCPLFDLQNDDQAAQCKFPVPDALKNEDVFFSEDGLPGNVPIQSGPAEATSYGNSASPATTSAPTYSSGEALATATAGGGHVSVHLHDGDSEYDLVIVEDQVIVVVDAEGQVVGTTVEGLRTIATTQTLVSVPMTELTQPTETAAVAAGARHHFHNHHRRRRNHIRGLQGWS